MTNANQPSRARALVLALAIGSAMAAVPAWANTFEDPCDRSLLARVPYYDPAIQADPRLNSSALPRRLGDPRVRPVQGLPELHYIASRVAAASGMRLRGRIVVSSTGLADGAMVRMRGPQHGGTLEIDEVALQQLSANAMAFAIGHAFAHQLLGHGERASLAQAQAFELQADAEGARLATCAGFDPQAYLQETFEGPSMEPGGTFASERAQAIRRALGLVRRERRTAGVQSPAHHSSRASCPVGADPASGLDL